MFFNNMFVELEVKLLQLEHSSIDYIAIFHHASVNINVKKLDFTNICVRTNF